MYEEEWLLGVRGDRKTRCIYQLSDELSINMLKDDNVREIHKNKFHKLRIYELFKTTLEMERYLRGVNSVYKRMLITRFRCGILSLRIETGRYENNGNGK